VSNKEEELDIIKKKVKVTKIKELENELDIVYSHLHQLKLFIDSNVIKGSPDKDQNSSIERQASASGKQIQQMKNTISSQ